MSDSRSAMRRRPQLRALAQLIFMSRWLQLPLYLGLIVAQGVYVWQFWVELVHLVEATLGDSAAAKAVNASVLKVKLATAIIGISSIRLLRTYINAEAYDTRTLFCQTTIHIDFLLSAMAIAAVDRLLPPPVHAGGNGTKAHR